MALVDNIIKSKGRTIGQEASFASFKSTKSLQDKEMAEGRIRPSSVLPEIDSCRLAETTCPSCGGFSFWTDLSANERCELCEPPISELYVSSRTNYSLPSNKSPDGRDNGLTTSTNVTFATKDAATTSPPEPFQSVFTERQWEVAGERLLRKFAEREANAIAYKKTQELTDEQNELIAWAKSQIEPTNDQPMVNVTPSTSNVTSITSEPITLDRHHTIANPITFIAWAVDYLKPRQFRRRCRPPDEPTSIQYPTDADDVLKTLSELRRAIVSDGGLAK